MNKTQQKPPKEPINTQLECPNCKTKIDVSGIKQAIKNRLYQELDWILEEI